MKQMSLTTVQRTFSFILDFSGFQGISNNVTQYVYSVNFFYKTVIRLQARPSRSSSE